MAVDVQEILKKHWEKVALGVISFVCLLILGMQFLSPPEAITKSAEIEQLLNQVIASIKKSAPPPLDVPKVSEKVKSFYTDSPPEVKGAYPSWVFYKKPYVWQVIFKGPEKQMFHPEFYPPLEFRVKNEANGIRLSWKNNPRNKYCKPSQTFIYRKKDAGEFELLAKVDGSVQEYLDTNIAPRSKYVYYLKSYAKIDSSRDDVYEFEEGKNVQITRQSEVVKTLPEIVMGIYYARYGQWMTLAKKVNGKWRLEGRRLSKNRVFGQSEPSAKFLIWIVDKEGKKLKEFYTDDIPEGEHIVAIKKYQRPPVFQDSGLKLVRIATYQTAVKQFGNVRKIDMPVAFTIHKSVNQALLDIALSPLGLEGETPPLRFNFSKEDGEKQKKEVEEELSKFGK
ncbi:MAG: hypothetical protein D6805_01970 [Planctomycetota bacterium]|nr:MAG: hypothetical protein D6805_01970 [Planctomycetota bacterium]